MAASHKSEGVSVEHQWDTAMSITATKEPFETQKTSTGSASIPAKAPKWAAAMRRITNYLVNDFAGGPRPWKFAWVINFQKTGTFPLLALLPGIIIRVRQFGSTWPCMAAMGWSGLSRT
jgi:hypothetical protein